jgi:hypothetical protein
MYTNTDFNKVGNVRTVSQRSVLGSLHPEPLLDVHTTQSTGSHSLGHDVCFIVDKAPGA